MNRKEWKARIKKRNDMATRLTHLTRGESREEAFENLWKILMEKKINGSGRKGYINGNRTAVCLQELPLNAVAENLFYEKELDDKVRYSPFGLRFHKGFIYNKGGRPVIYESKNIMKKMLPEDEQWRIVDFDLSNADRYIDWSHEREWRVPDNLEFDYCDVEIIVASDKYYRKFVKKCISENRIDLLTGIHGIITLNSVYL